MRSWRSLLSCPSYNVTACTPRSWSCSATSKCRFIHTQNVTADSTVLSAIQPTGIPHLGNWLGTLNKWVDLQHSSARLMFAVADLHSITVPQEATELRRWRREAFATLIAIGLDPKRCTLFYQSDVAAHTELMWILSCTSSLGSLLRMTTWKSKVAVRSDSDSLDAAAQAKVRLGLLAYPVLQAADILVHRANYVPVGADQTQHLEFARECARSFNGACGSVVLPEPQALYSPVPRVMSLRDPSVKMSKSATDPRSRIILTDSYDEIKKKVRASLTDSVDGITYAPETRPGIANLLKILTYLDDEGRSVDDLTTDLANHSMLALKEHVAERIDQKVKPIRQTFNHLMEDSRASKDLEEIAQRGAVEANRNATVTLQAVRTVLGL